MPFYDLPKEERAAVVAAITTQLLRDLRSGMYADTLARFADEDTYIRKTAYVAMGRLYSAEADLRGSIISLLDDLATSPDHKVRQTAINAAGEIGMADFGAVCHFFDRGLFDPHHSPRNAVIGSVKKMGEVNPGPVLLWAQQYLHHPDKEIRREICHGIELRGRKHPQDILPMLRELQHDTTARVRNTLVHVIGQIAYKRGCLPVVIADLNTWDNKPLVQAALEEIIDVHLRYRNFAHLTQEQARQYIAQHYKG
jgi:HEAT repeats